MVSNNGRKNIYFYIYLILVGFVEKSTTGCIKLWYWLWSGDPAPAGITINIYIPISVWYCNWMFYEILTILFLKGISHKICGLYHPINKINIG